MVEPAAFASIDELEARVGAIPTDERARAHGCLVDATNLVRAEVPSATWTADSVPGVVVTVTLAVAARVFRNPDGISSQSVGSVSETYSPATLGVYLLPAERETVRRAGGSGGLRTVRFRREIDDETVYLPVAGSTEQVPWVNGDWR